MTSKFLLDANVFIESKKKHYAFDIAPSFWNALIAKAKTGEIGSVDKVLDEIEAGQDELTEWVSKNWPYFELTTTSEVLTSYATLMQWSQNQNQFSSEAKQEFALSTNADAWLIAFAMENKATIVTHEDLNFAKKSKILIPVVCHSHSVVYCDTFEMLRKLGIRL